MVTSVSRPSRKFEVSKTPRLNTKGKAAWLKDSLPWFGQEFEETRALMGDNYYSYGIEPNRNTLKSLFRYSYQQGFCNRELTIEELNFRKYSPCI